ncbi:hypothetical protein ACTXG7_07695 [Mycolicibacterium sp. Dal123E01]|uniref:hypothetical protein n=1 Tax=Mycolicibacterium sp. Dal123E01 TaxID=3457578 RepID=UPI00403EEC48
MTDLELNAGICVYLKHYPGKNDDEFAQLFEGRSDQILARVRELLTEAMKVEVDWTGLTLSEGGDVVRDIMAQRHPELAPEALAAIRRYYTYLMR